MNIDEIVVIILRNSLRPRLVVNIYARIGEHRGRKKKRKKEEKIATPRVAEDITRRGKFWGVSVRGKDHERKGAFRGEREDKKIKGVIIIYVKIIILSVGGFLSR